MCEALGSIPRTGSWGEEGKKRKKFRNISFEMRTLEFLLEKA
jgi:hypothetical protein